ncbi:hypothetical protein F0562_027021 [Nyssa sinensis]|uniref:BHLH domain-containing protein n=1 Tax=Nyssa sinensis TaxID=561372 RepID=A0A5J5B636_9ASTE|nr:hypothetical protein F0562_027021 [Nyssa sinensis]
MISPEGGSIRNTVVSCCQEGERMDFESVVFQQDMFGYDTKDLYNLLEGNWSCDFDLIEENVSFHNLENYQVPSCQYENWTCSPPSMVPHLLLQHPPPPNVANAIIPEEYSQHVQNTSSSRPKRRSSKSKKNKNKEEIENQRMTHITIERNRRKQMNDYLSELRALMPDSYVPKADQASIVGGAINYVKELEQRLQSLGGQEHIKQMLETDSVAMDDPSDENQIEVSLVESHGNLKIRWKRRPKQLLKLVSGLESLGLTILHLNVTTVDQMVLYSLSIKLEDDCKLTSVEEISAAVNKMLGRIQEEALLI